MALIHVSSLHLDNNGIYWTIGQCSHLPDSRVFVVAVFVGCVGAGRNSFVNMFHWFPGLAWLTWLAGHWCIFSCLVAPCWSLWQLSLVKGVERLCVVIQKSIWSLSRGGWILPVTASNARRCCDQPSLPCRVTVWDWSWDGWGFQFGLYWIL